MILITILYYAPLLIAGAVVVAAWMVPAVRRRLPRAHRLPQSSRPDSAVRAVLGIAAMALVLYTAGVFQHMFGHEFGLGVSHDDYRWWNYAQALLFACLTLVIVAVLLLSYRRRSEEPVAPTVPRIWRSFTPSRHLWLLGASVLALLVFVAFAGSASSPDRDGYYRVLEIDSGDGVIAEVVFFGWAYGMPTAGAAAILLVLTITGLRLNAARRFLKPDTMAAEESSRSVISDLLVWFAAGVVLATLGHAMNLSSRAGGLTMTAEGYSWGTTMAALSPWLYGLALTVQLVAYIALMLVVTVAFRRSDSGARVGTRGAADG